MALLVISTVKAEPIDTSVVHIGNVGNAPDPLTGRGAVNYDYCIGKYNITIAEYTAFLNAVAKRDKYHLYSPRKMDQMGRMVNSQTVNEIGTHWDTGIARSGNDGSYTYSVIGTSGSIPAIFITWFDAARFCNWMHNGQPAEIGEVAGSTETGAYTLNGDYRKGGQKRNPDAKWWIPSADEWYKAAYYDPHLNGGAGGYWKYATQNNNPPGNTIGSGSNEANAIVNDNDPFFVKVKQNACLLVPVDSFPNSHSYYGCYDMCGNAGQWTDTIIITPLTHAKSRGQVGGYANAYMHVLQSINNRCTLGGVPDRAESWVVGFRVATVPRSKPEKH